MDELEPKAQHGTPGWVAPAQTIPVRRLLPPRAFETIPELVLWAEKGRKISVHPFVFRRSGRNT